MKIMRFRATYGAPPIFDPEVATMGYVDPSEMNLPLELVQRLMHWNDEYQRTFSEGYPPDSGFKSDTDRMQHNHVGASLAQSLQNELGPTYRVEFREV